MREIILIHSTEYCCTLMLKESSSWHSKIRDSSVCAIFSQILIISSQKNYSGNYELVPCSIKLDLICLRMRSSTTVNYLSVHSSKKMAEGVEV